MKRFGTLILFAGARPWLTQLKTYVRKAMCNVCYYLCRLFSLFTQVGMILDKADLADDGIHKWIPSHEYTFFIL